MASPASRSGFYEDDEDWQETDFWYNRVMDAKNPASQIANPSALALITFGLTTALLQVRSPVFFRNNVVASVTFTRDSTVSSVYIGSKHILDRNDNGVRCCGLHGVFWRHGTNNSRPDRVCQKQHVCWHSPCKLWSILDWLWLVLDSGSRRSHPRVRRKRLTDDFLPSWLSEFWIFHVRLLLHNIVMITQCKQSILIPASTSHNCP